MGLFGIQGSRWSWTSRALFPLFLMLVLALVTMQPALAGGCIAPRPPGGDPEAPPHDAPPPPPPPPPDDVPPSDPPADDPDAEEPEDPVDTEEPEEKEDPVTPSEDDTPEEDPITPSETDEPETAEEPAPPTPPASPTTPPSTPKAPGATGPGAGPFGGGSGAPQFPSGARRPRTSNAPTDPMVTWRGWWMVNDRALLPERADDLAVTTPSPTDAAVSEGRRHRRELAVRMEILPALRKLLAPEMRVSDLLRRTALLALGKLGQSAEDSALLVHWLQAKHADKPVREAAALGLGLLRRTEPSRQLDAQALDALRLQLTRIVEDETAPDEVRATCAISIGLLGDQPFGQGIHRDGRLVTQRLWRNLEAEHARKDIPVALLVALGMQPERGVPDGVREALSSAIFGRTTLGRRWDDVERSHALTALVRLGGTRALTIPPRVLLPRRMPPTVRRAGLIAVGRSACSMSLEERLEAATTLRGALQRVRDPQSRGLAWIAIGRLVGAYVTAGDPLARDLQALWRQLLAEARSGPVVSRGFAVLGVGLAARPLPEEQTEPRSLRQVRGDAEEILLAGLERASSPADLRGAYAIALGIMRARSAVPVLVRQVEDRRTAASLRSDAANALGQIGYGGPEVVRALQLAMSERRHPRVQSGAALALSLLRGPAAGSRLLRELEHSLTNTDVLRLTEPLGYLGDPSLARTLVAYVLSEKNGDYPRAFMVVALGNIGDPEPRPSLAAVGEDANYPAATQTLLDTITTR